MVYSFYLFFLYFLEYYRKIYVTYKNYINLTSIKKYRYRNNILIIIGHDFGHDADRSNEARRASA